MARRKKSLKNKMMDGRERKRDAMNTATTQARRPVTELKDSSATVASDRALD